MALKLIISPTQEPITLQEAKSHLRVDATDDDILISSLITAAREYCEAFQNRAYITQTWEFWLDDWPVEGYISIPKPPLQEIVSVKYYDAVGYENTFAAENYYLDDKNQPGGLVLAYGKSWPSTTLCPSNGICITFTAGYGTAAQVPVRVKQAMLLLIGHWYENREAVLTGSISKEIEFAVSSLLWQERVVPV